MGATGLGALFGALTLANRNGLKGLGSWAAAAAAGFGAALVLFSVSRWFWPSAVILIATGFCMMLQMACTNTLLQSMVPDRLRGRVMALYSMMFMGMAPFGALFAGLVASRLGAPITVATGGLVSILGAGIFASRLALLRGEARQLILAQRMVAAEPPEEMTARGTPVGGEEA
jgi:MFS family permease